MKFTDGFWHPRPRVDARYAQEAYDLETGPDGRTLVISGPTKTIATRGDTLNRTLLTITLSSPLQGVIAVRVDHHTGARRSKGFELVGAQEGVGRVL
jgi:alpha-D-xyloside xylohydrolase